MYGGLGSILLLISTGCYFVGALLYVFFKDNHEHLTMFQSNIIEVFRETIILAVVSVGIILAKVVLDIPPFFSITQAYDG